MEETLRSVRDVIKGESRGGGKGYMRQHFTYVTFELTPLNR